jgi:murein DD-endopeptidase MepM/ murein hydrolase activator NlpD
MNNPRGAPVSYGENRHPGIDFDIAGGTSIIAATDGEIILILDSESARLQGGIYVKARHGSYFDILYAHLTKVFVKKGEFLKRGQLIGLSGKTYDGNYHLHFGVCKSKGDCRNYSDTLDPDQFWLGGKPQCFDPNTDYSSYTQKEITLPIACGEYANALIAQTKEKD